MKKHVKILIWIIAALLVVGIAVFAYVGYFVPYHNALTHFSETSPVILHQQADGSVLIEWPDAPEADQYLIEISMPLQEGQKEATVEFSQYLTENSVTVGALDGERTVSIYTVGEYYWPFSKTPRLRVSKDAVRVSDDFTPPAIKSLTWKVNELTDTVRAELQIEGGDVGRLFFVTAEGAKYQRDIEGNEVVLAFGDGKTYKMPSHDETYEFCFDAYRQTESYVYYGKMTQAVTLVRDDLLGTNLVLTCTEEANDSVTFTWNETKGDYYLLQARASSKNEWKTVLKVDATESREYRVNGLKPYSYEEYRVIAQNDGDDELMEPVAQTEAFPLQTASVLQYCTIWNIQELDIFSDSQKTESLGKISAGTTFCALDIENGMFRVRYNNGYGYLDSNYCMINLAEFLGDLCKYNITNSYSSIYKFHSLPIPEVTDTVIVGYENIKLSDTQYVVPLLYPTALKFEQAAKAAREDGYYIKIYDSFRPQAATLKLYSLATEHCKREVTEEDLASLPEEERPVIEEGQVYTYEQWVTDNGRYTLNYFLAKGVSMHNRGLALDMTLEKKGEDLEMQSDMHDLTWHSEIKQNTTYANVMAKYMKNAGFSGLVSEWWHFQDNEARDNLNPTALKNGVSLKGWVADANGWRFRTEKNVLYKDCTRTIDGVSYSFDKNGYVIE